MEPQHNIIGTVTHTMEAQTPVTDKILSDFMYKNFKQTEKLKRKYTATKTKLKKTRQELEDVKSRKPESTYTTTETISPKKTVTCAKNTMNKKSPQKGKVSTKAKVSKPTATMAATTSSSATKTKVKTEPSSTLVPFLRNKSPPTFAIHLIWYHLLTHVKSSTFKFLVRQ